LKKKGRDPLKIIDLLRSSGLSSDEHLHGMDFEQLTIELQNFDLSAPVIATPAEVVRKFFLR
jgi:hypothetical protein